MAKSTDEIYDLLVALDKKVERHIAVTDLRLARLEERQTRGWQFWMAILASPITGFVLALWGINAAGGTS